MKLNLRPQELWNWRYWLHLAVLAFTVLTILQLWKGGEMLSIKNVFVSIPLLAIGDIVAHNLLKID